MEATHQGGLLQIMRDNRIHRLFSHATVALMVVFAMPMAMIDYAFAQSNIGDKDRLITFHDRGNAQVVLTQADTVRDALDDAGIQVVSEDIVQPSLDEPLVAADYTVNIYRARPVIVVDGLVRTKIMTASQTAEGIAEQAGVTLRDEDRTRITASKDFINDGHADILTIDRAAEFTLDLYGTKSTTYSHADTVGEMLANKDIVLGDKDKVSPSEEAAITNGMTVTVWREGVQTRTVKESVNYETRYIHDVDQPLGYSRVETPGVKGTKNVTYEITIKNGKEVSRKVLQTVVLTKPKTQVEVIGAKGGLAAAMARLRQCESGGNYANKNNSLYRGAYQFSYETWANNGGYRDPADAPPSLQDAAAAALYQRRGWQPWPACSASLGLQDIYR